MFTVDVKQQHNNNNNNQNSYVTKGRDGNLFLPTTITKTPEKEWQPVSADNNNQNSCFTKGRNGNLFLPTTITKSPVPPREEMATCFTQGMKWQPVSTENNNQTPLLPRKEMTTYSYRQKLPKLLFHQGKKWQPVSTDNNYQNSCFTKGRNGNLFLPTTITKTPVSPREEMATCFYRQQ